MVQAVRIPSYEELYQLIVELPENLTGEIPEPGVLRTMSRPGTAHRHAARALLRNLDGLDRSVGGKGWWIEVEAEIRFPGGRLFVPDLSGFRVERVPDRPNENPIPILPDWCCEVLSESTARYDATTKLRAYARAGIQWVWLIDPERRLVEVFETLGDRPALTATGEEAESVVLPPFDVEVSVGTLWLPQSNEERATSR